MDRREGMTHKKLLLLAALLAGSCGGGSPTDSTPTTSASSSAACTTSGQVTFVRDVLQQLPMEFMAETQKLIGISLEGSVG